VKLAGEKRTQLVSWQLSTGFAIWTMATATPGGWSRSGQGLEIYTAQGASRVMLL
jgi:hypothetical protein